MSKILLAFCVLAVLVMVSCRPTVAPVPTTPLSSAASPLLPTPIGPQAVPQATPEAPSNPVSTTVATSGIHLTATIGPTCPGPERPGQVCTRPYEGVIIVADTAGTEVARAATDQNGQVTINLPPGTYAIAPQVEGKFPSSAATTVTVVFSQYAEVSLGLDSGIR
jgi:hypothetical protein